MVISFSAWLSVQPTQAAAAKWHSGTPKVIRGSWYHHSRNHNQNSYITYYRHSDASNYLGWSEKHHAYFELPGHGLGHYSYQSLGHHRYRLHGTDEQIPAGPKYTFVIKATKYNLWTNHGKTHFNRHKPRLISEEQALSS